MLLRSGISSTSRLHVSSASSRGCHGDGVTTAPRVEYQVNEKKEDLQNVNIEGVSSSFEDGSV